MYSTYHFKNKIETQQDLIYVNILRRLLLKYSKGYGVKEITVKTNTSSYMNLPLTDRIQQIPFSAQGMYTCITKDTQTVYTDSIEGPGVYKDILVLQQDKPFSLDFTLVVAEANGLVHAKYNPIHSVAVKNKSLYITTLNYKTWLTLKHEILTSL